MEVIFWVLGIHLAELLAFSVYLLVNKNIKLEKAISIQNQHIETMSFIASQLSSSLSKIDAHMYVEGDPELQEVFDQIKEFKSILDDISNK
jgi:DUF1680 family protein